MKYSLLIVLLLPAVCSSEFIVSPNLPVSGYNGIPFWPGLVKSRYQQVHDATQFAGPLRIDSFAFSPGSTGSYAADVEIRLGVTDTVVGALSPDLDVNIEEPLAIVYSDSFSQSVTSARDDSFSIVFAFSSPFVYEPSDGNLLIEIQVENGSSMSDGPGKVYGFSNVSGNPLASRAWESLGAGSLDNGAGSGALHVKMEVTSVPESSPLLVLCLACSPLAAFRWWRAKVSIRANLEKETGRFVIETERRVGRRLRL